MLTLRKVDYQIIMKKRTLKIGAVAGLIILSGLLYGYYGILYKPVRDISTEESAFKLAAGPLADEYEKNMKTADAKYLNHTVEVNGRVTEIRDSLLILDERIVCSFDTKPTVGLNKQITIKGRCIGFDELFGEVKFDQCTIK